MKFHVNDRVIVRLGGVDQVGTVTRIQPRNQVTVATDSGDCRNWPVSSVRPAGGEQR